MSPLSPTSPAKCLTFYPNFHPELRSRNLGKGCPRLFFMISSRPSADACGARDVRHTHTHPRGRTFRWPHASPPSRARIPERGAGLTAKTLWAKSPAVTAPSSSHLCGGGRRRGRERADRARPLPKVARGGRRGRLPAQHRAHGESAGEVGAARSLLVLRPRQSGLTGSRDPLQPGCRPGCAQVPQRCPDTGLSCRG